jgi:hypothetical protein
MPDADGGASKKMAGMKKGGFWMGLIWLRGLAEGE